MGLGLSEHVHVHVHVHMHVHVLCNMCTTDGFVNGNCLPPFGACGGHVLSFPVINIL